MIVLILALSVSTSPTQTRDHWLPVVKAAAEHYDIDWHLLDGLIWAESHWNPNAVSSVGAQGLTQLMPTTAEHLKVINPFEPGQAIWGGAWYLRQMMNLFGNWKLALAAYNAGPGAVRRHNGIPPYRETQDYVSKIEARMMPTFTSGVN